MIVVRLARGGAKKHPFYHIVVTDSRRPRDSGYIEKLGYFNPLATKEELPVFLNQDRFDYWVAKGAKSSPRISSIISKLAKGKFSVKTQTKEAVKNTDTSAKQPDSVEAKEKASDESKATASQTEPELKDTQPDPQEAKQPPSSEQTLDTGSSGTVTNEEPPLEEAMANKKDEDK